MTITPIRLPPGVYRNGTPYSAKGRWYETDKVRWYAGSARPIGGWEPATDFSYNDIPPIVSDPTTETVRDAIAWTDLTGGPNAVFGSNEELYYLDATNALDVITPDGVVLSGNQPSKVTGYGTGPYGRQSYGTPRQSTGSKYEQVTRWHFDTWGEAALASYSPGDTALYEWSIGDEKFTPVATAPTGFSDFVVTQQRFVMIVGDDTEYNLVRWSDRENYNEWTPQKTNEAGFMNLQTRAPFTSIGRVQNQALILGLDAYVARHVGSPYVYAFDMVGRNCPAIHPKTIIYTDRFAMWIGYRTFWLYDGTVKAMPCDVMDWLVENINYDQISKVHTVVNSEFNELWWFFQSDDSTGDVDTYVAFNYVSNFWMHGKMDRTAGVDTGVYRNALYVGVDGDLYFHELNKVEVPGAYCETGPLEIGEGEQVAAIRQVFHDTQGYGTVNLTILGRQMPTDAEYAYGPYEYNNPTPTRAIGRQFRLRFDGVSGAWEVGTPRVDLIAGGRR